MAIADEAILTSFGNQSGQELLPALNRSAAMMPLVLFFAFVPGLIALRYHVLDEEGAAWGLRGITVLQQIHDQAEPNTWCRDQLAGVEFLPPLGAWLIALSLQLLCGTKAIAVAIPSYLAMAGVVVMTWVWGKSAIGHRGAFLAATLAAVHAPLWLGSRDPGPAALTLLCVLIVFWGFDRHGRLDIGFVSFPLLIAGIGLGLCLLAGGVLAIVVLALLALSFLFKLPPHHREATRADRRPITTRFAGSVSLVILALTGFAVGGWWIMMMSSEYGTAFWTTWLHDVAIGSDSPNASAVALIPTGVGFGEQIITLTGVLGCLSLFGIAGVWWATTASRNKTSNATLDVKRAVSPDRPESSGNGSLTQPKPVSVDQYSILASWTVCAVAAWIVMWATARSSPATSSTLMQTTWSCFLAYPFVIWSAVGFDAILQRRHGIVAVTTLTMATALVYLAAVTQHTSNWDLLRPAVLWSVITGLIVAAPFCVWTVRRWCGKDDVKLRIALSFCLATMAALHVTWGYNCIRSDAEKRHEFWQLAAQLRRLGNVTHFTLVADAPPTFRLQYILASSRLDAGHELITLPPTPDDSEAVVTSDTKSLNQTIELLTDQVIMTWGKPDMPLTSAKWRRLFSDQITIPVYFEGRVLSVFGRASRSE